MLRQLRPCSVLMLGLAPIPAAMAQTSPALPGDAVQGEALALTWCANCHDVGRTARPATSDAVPGFASIARLPSTTAMSLRVFLLTPHGDMPDYHLGRRELDDVIAYLLSLRGE